MKKFFAAGLVFSLFARSAVAQQGLTQDQIYEKEYQILRDAAIEAGVPVPPRTPKKPVETLLETDKKLVDDFEYYASTGLGIELKEVDSQKAAKIRQEVAKRVQRLIDHGLKVDALASDSFDRKWSRLIHFTYPAATIEFKYFGTAFEVFVKSGADLDVVDSRGQTALIGLADGHSSFRDAAKVMELLLENGADPFVKDLDGKTAMDYLDEQIRVLSSPLKDRSIKLRKILEAYLTEDAAFARLEKRKELAAVRAQAAERAAQLSQEALEAIPRAQMNHPADEYRSH